jgi:phytoene synthase
MEQYELTSHNTSRLVTLHYSSSFGMASRLFPNKIRSAIYDVYALVRIADEIVDTYKGEDRDVLLRNLANETYAALERGYSTNIIVQAFIETAVRFDIGRDLLQPFFESMKMDITADVVFDEVLLDRYIYGSAEVIGLMCLKIFCGGKKPMFDSLQQSAMKLGSAYQKVNFMRDMASDHKDLGRYYFPVGSFNDFDETTKELLILDIENDFQEAIIGIRSLPAAVRPAVYVSYCYYGLLLKKLKNTSAVKIKSSRIRISNFRKIIVLITAGIHAKTGRI